MINNGKMDLLQGDKEEDERVDREEQEKDVVIWYEMRGTERGIRVNIYIYIGVVGFNFFPLISVS